MKRTLLTTLLALGIFTSASFAEVAVYRGAAPTKSTSSVISGSFPVKAIVVLDLNTNQIATINTVKILFKKFYKQGPTLGPVSITSITDKKTKKTSTALAYGGTTTDAQSGAKITSSVVLSGVNGQVDLVGDPINFAKTLKGNASILVGEGSIGGTPTPTALVTSTLSLKIDEKTSKAYNADGKTLSQAVDALIAELGDGYDDGSDFLP